MIGGREAEQKNAEMAAALLGEGKGGGEKIVEGLASLCVDVVAPDSCWEGGDALVACRTALNLLPRIVGLVRYSGSPEVMAGLQPSVRKAIRKGGGRQRQPLLTLSFGGGGGEGPGGETVHVGACGWSAYLSRRGPCPWECKGQGAGMGAMAAGALAVGEAFKAAFPEANPAPAYHLEYDLVTHGAAEQPVLDPVLPECVDIGATAIVGCGAIGQAACLALLTTGLAGTAVLVDHEYIDESNVQRYALGSEETVGRQKAELMAQMLGRGNPHLRTFPVAAPYEDFALWQENGTAFENMVVCVDNVETRVNVQGAVPRAVWNGWTDNEHGSLGYGVSRHAYDGMHACVSCYYRRSGGPEPTRHELAAARTGMPAETIARMEESGEPCTEEHVRAAAWRMGVQYEDLARHVGRPIRELLHGECGVFRLAGDRGEGATAPAPHQSMMAGVLLASQVVLSRLIPPGGPGPVESAAEFDALRLPGHTCLYRAPRRKGCICGDPAYTGAYARKWGGWDGGRGRE